MSAQHLSRFLDRVVVDHGLRTELTSAETSAAAVAAVAARHGYGFTPNELLARVRPLGDDEWRAASHRFDPTPQLGRPDTYVLFLEELPMSMEAISAFLKKATEDPALQKKLVELAAAEGFEFSADELNDADLDSVAGGVLMLKLQTLDPMHKVQPVDLSAPTTDTTLNR